MYLTVKAENVDHTLPLELAAHLLGDQLLVALRVLNVISAGESNPLGQVVKSLRKTSLAYEAVFHGNLEEGVVGAHLGDAELLEGEHDDLLGACGLVDEEILGRLVGFVDLQAVLGDSVLQD